MTNNPPNLSQLADMTQGTAVRIAPYIWKTPVEFSPELSRMTGARVYLKAESLQSTGSFKIRGAANRILTLAPDQQKRGLVTASTGNHAAAFATVVDHLNLPGTIFLPKTASAEKISRLTQFKVQLEQIGSDCLEAEQAAIRFARQHDLTYISPYNHPEIIAGQGTIGLELLEQTPDMTHLFCPVGGGGLISGVAAVLKQRRGDIRIIGCQPVNSKVMYESIKAGEILDIESEPTISDGTAGGVEPGAITFEYCRELIDRFCLLTENEIRAAIKLIADHHQLIIEGSAALSVAGLIKSASELKGANVTAILTGRRLSRENIRLILGTEPDQD